MHCLRKKATAVAFFINYIFSGAETPIKSNAFAIVTMQALTRPSLSFVNSGLDGSDTLQEL